MKVVLASTAGFCLGVKRALEMVLKAINENQTKIYTYGPLIHNPRCWICCGNGGSPSSSRRRWCRMAWW